ncbi:MAG: UDP-N-acetylglucosamine diphosphorylase/glucosamine-1-phosphate N-acetyltransferase [Burkholderiaceae bacterium]|nr:MAG: UDP-N-acetylglucosamine diphosphorylase/glucosamine-1-phosphate N-acetyltransferase [Burkholderiaceae bacterium]
MNIVILAAGMGKRMRSALPKVLHPLAGKPLLQHVLDTARQLKPTRICIVYGHGGEAVLQQIKGDDLHWAKQEPQLGTGHAVQQAVPFLDDAQPTLILYGDVPLTRLSTLQTLTAQVSTAQMALLTVELDDPTGYGRIVRDANDTVQQIVEHKDATPAQRMLSEINTGIMVVPTAQLKRWLTRLSNNNAQGEYYLTDIVASAVAEGVTVATAAPQDEWETLGVNSRLQMAELERIYQNNLAEELLEQGVALADPARIDVRGTLTCGRDVFIDVNCVFEGEVVLSDGVQIAANCVIRNAHIDAGTQIAPFTHIDDARVGAGGKVGPFARLRPGTVLAEDVHIGNFVEVKNSAIAAHSKANHLAYVGDADVGSNVNIGAGTITCNYDGANKFRTTIEDDVFIGSDTQLVAPVRVGKGATLGAGTTLTKDAPAGKLTVSRTKQVTLENWQRPRKQDK